MQDTFFRCFYSSPNFDHFDDIIADENNPPDKQDIHLHLSDSDFNATVYQIVNNDCSIAVFAFALMKKQKKGQKNSKNSFIFKQSSPVKLTKAGEVQRSLIWRQCPPILPWWEVQVIRSLFVFVTVRPPWRALLCFASPWPPPHLDAVRTNVFP